MSVKHTAGPWTYSETKYGEEQILDDNGEEVVRGTVEGGITFWNDANARLIATAPDLLEALQELVDHCRETEKAITEMVHHIDYCGESLPLCNARAAIAKATGEPA